MLRLKGFAIKLGQLLFDLVWLLIGFIPIPLILAIWLASPGLARADEPVGQELQITYSNVYTSPFDFTPGVIPTVSPSEALSITLSIDDINLIGRMVTTTFALIDQYEIMGIMLVVLLAIFLLRWLFKFVTGMPSRGERLNASTGIDDFFDLQRLGLDFDDEEIFEDAVAQSRTRQRRARGILRFLRRR